MKVLVTGGRGLVGRNLQEIQPEWTYISSNDLDLRNRQSTFDWFQKKITESDSGVPFDCIIALAANVGGLFKNQAKGVEMFIDNLDINNNTILAATRFQIPKVILILSTCVFPAEKSEFTELSLHSGPPHKSNQGYAYAKRMGAVLADLVNHSSDHTTQIQYVSPCNLYGKFDRFDPVSGHVLPSLIQKASRAHSLNQTTLRCKGTGKPLRQFLFAPDFAQILSRVVNNRLNFTHLIVAPPQEYTIAQVAELIADHYGLSTQFNRKYNENGIYRKKARSILFHKLFPNFEFTPLQKGLTETMDWYEEYHELY